MATQGKPVDVEQVACEICLKEVPKSEAMVAEAEDYFVYFCGLECYARWTGRKEEPDQEDGTKGR